MPVMRPFTSQVCDPWITSLGREKIQLERTPFALATKLVRRPLHPAHGSVRRTRLLLRFCFVDEPGAAQAFRIDDYAVSTGA